MIYVLYGLIIFSSNGSINARETSAFLRNNGSGNDLRVFKRLKDCRMLKRLSYRGE